MNELYWIESCKSSIWIQEAAKSQTFKANMRTPCLLLSRVMVLLLYRINIEWLYSLAKGTESYFNNNINLNLHWNNSNLLAIPLLALVLNSIPMFVIIVLVWNYHFSCSEQEFHTTKWGFKWILFNFSDSFALYTLFRFGIRLL